ncbi:MAG: hypothetical protein WBE44_00135 [Terriglobales bacterium]|jgi:hypothetical protein
MSEITSNVEFAHKIHEQGHHHPSGSDIRERWVEILEAVVLAMVAVATAWRDIDLPSSMIKFCVC